MSRMSEDRVDLWSGWSVSLPPGCESARNDDASWSAWDATHAIDAGIIDTSGRQDGSPLSAEEMMGDETRGELHQLDGAIVRISTDIETTDTADGPQSIEWTRVNAAAVNTALIMSIGNAGERDVAWHDLVWRSVRHETKQPERFGGLFGKR